MQTLPRQRGRSPVGSQIAPNRYRTMFISIANSREFARHSERGDRPAARPRSFTGSDDLCNAEPTLIGGTMSNKQRLTVYSFRLEVVHAMRTAYRRAMARQRLLPRSSLSSRKLGRPI